MGAKIKKFVLDNLGGLSFLGFLLSFAWVLHTSYLAPQYNIKDIIQDCEVLEEKLLESDYGTPSLRQQAFDSIIDTHTILLALQESEKRKKDGCCPE